MPTLMGFHLTPIHNVIHVLTGAIALYLGFSASYDAARTFCLIFGFSSTCCWESSASWRQVLWPPSSGIPDR